MYICFICDEEVKDGAIPCCEPDVITGHHPHWVKVDKDKPEDKWFVAAYERAKRVAGELPDGTYEAVGEHFQGNPYKVHDTLFVHGKHILDVPRTFDGIKQYLADNNIEGIVFWLDDEPKCKIKRSDFGFKWR